LQELGQRRRRGLFDQTHARSLLVVPR
jgi:hypothetical protein